MNQRWALVWELVGSIVVLAFAMFLFWLAADTQSVKLTILALIMSAVWALTMFWVFRTTQRIFTPALRISLFEHPITIGDKARLSWERTEGIGLSPRTSLILRCQERVTRSSGTTSSVDTTTVFEIQLADHDARDACEVVIEIPQGCQPTWEAGNTELRWMLEARVIVDWWANRVETYTILVVVADAEEG